MCMIVINVSRCKNGGGAGGIVINEDACMAPKNLFPHTLRQVKMFWKYYIFISVFTTTFMGVLVYVYKKFPAGN